jgi:GAF domain-containing protein/sensor histidine kinase YesM
MSAPPHTVRRPLFRKYVALFVAVVAVALLANGVLEIWFSYQEHKTSLIRIQREQAEAAAAKIGQFVKEIENQLGWTTQLPWSASTVEQRRFDGLRLLRQVPAITELSMVDARGKEQLRVSRLAMDVVGSGIDVSNEPKFTEAVARKVYYGPVYFRRESEPYMTLALAGTRRDAGVSIAEVNLKLIWEVISKIRVGQRGYAYVVDAQGRLIAHPDISLVLRNTDLSGLQQVKAARAGEAGAPEQVQVAESAQGRSMLTAHAPVAPLGWLVFVEMPLDEAYAPLNASIRRTGVLMLGALVLAVFAGFFLARKMIVPIRTLREGAERIGGGDLAQRIAVNTGDELEALADQFNDMAGRLQESYADLEKKVELRTAELSEALQQQTATAEVLKVISRSTFDLQAVLDTLVQSAVFLCDADMGAIARQSGTAFHYAATHGFSPEAEEYLRSVPHERGRGSVIGRALLDGRIVQIPDVLADPDYKMLEAQRRAGFRTVLGVPLLREGNPIGVISLNRIAVRPFTEKQIELVTTFADQAVIAIENTRLFEEVQARTRELQESLEYQTATSEVLNVISRSPSVLQPVLDAIVKTAARLCSAEYAFIVRCNDRTCHLVAANNVELGHIKFISENPVPINHDTVTGRTALERRTIHVPDVLVDAQFKRNDWQEVGKQRTVLGVPLLREGELLGVMILARTAVLPFNDKNIDLVTTFADQAVIAINNARLFEEVQARTRELQESLEYQTATADVLNVISRSPSELQPVLDTIVETAGHLCEAYDTMILLRQDELLKIAAHQGPIPIDFDQWPVGRGWVTGRAVLDCKPVHVHDLRAAGDEFPDGQSMAQRLGHRTTLAAPLLRENVAIGAIAMRRNEVRPFSDKQVAVLQTFADQAVIAIENVRLFEEVQARTRELSEALEQQTATSEVLQAISRSTFDLQVVLETLVQSAARLCEADIGTITRQKDGVFYRTAQHGFPPDFAEKVKGIPVKPSRATVTGRTLLDGTIVHIADVTIDPEYDWAEAQEAVGFRTLLGLPLLRHGTPIGAMALGRRAVRPFTDKQIELVKTFADQAVIAIENVRLFEEVQARTEELSESLQQQTATADVLKVISNSLTDTQPVFDTIVQSGLKLFPGAAVSIALPECGQVKAVAVAEADPARAEAWRRRFPFPLTRDYMHSLAILDGRMVDIPDVEDAPPELAIGQRNFLGSGYRAVTIMPMMRGTTAIGALSVVRVAPGPLSDKELATLRTFANQAVIAIENTRLLNELQTRTQELARSVGELRALGEVSQTVNSTLDLETVLSTIVAKAVQLSATEAGAIYVYSKLRQKFRLRATYGMSDELISAIRSQASHLRDTAIGEAVAKREPVQVPDLHDEPPSPVHDIILAAGYRGLLIVPLLRGQQVVGALVVRRRQPGEFPKSTIDLLTTFAEQSVLAIQNARLFGEIEEKGRQLEIASRHKSQFLANMSHELRTPLNSVLGFTEMLADGLYGELPERAKAALIKVQNNGRHLLGLINDVLDLSKIEAGQLTLALDDYSVTQVVNSVVTSTESLARAKGLALTAEVASGLPIGRGDERRLTQVLFNLVGNAIKFTDTGSVAISARMVDGVFELAVRDTGPGIAPADQERIFEEFQQIDSSSTREKGGTGLGLAISRRIVEMHGGSIIVQSALGEGATFRIIVPVRAQEQREAA